MRALIVALVLANVTCIVVSNICFKTSAAAGNWRQFLTWQVFGNLAGFMGVLTLTALLRYLPLHIGYPLTVGLGVLGVQLLAARVFFREPIRPVQWLGTVLVIAGIVLIGAHHR